MLYRCLAAVLLLPASFVVFPSLRAWGRAFCQGIQPFFSVVIERAPERIGPAPSLALKLFVSWPMRLGVDLLGTKSLFVTARKALWKVRRRLANSLVPPPKPQTPANLGDAAYLKKPVSPLSIERIMAMIQNPAISVVSFDIFDTLLVRPALRPKDIFYLIARRVDRLYGIDFIALRWDAEKDLGNSQATIHDIYAFIQRKHGLSAETAQALLEEEIHCEKTLLAPRPDVARLYAEALRLGKRVIAVSDMYLPGTVLEDILRSKGYEELAAVYVSCDHGGRKSSGALFDVVIAAEGVEPAAMLHVGDNFASDYSAALEKKITAVYYPSVFDACFHTRELFERLLDGVVHNDPFWSILLGHSLNMLYSGKAPPPENIAILRDLRHFSLLTLGPLLTAYCLSIAGDESIQKTYRRLYFASRDGYLPKKIYDIVGEHALCIPGKYFYAGRRAYYPYLYSSFFDYAEKQRADNNGTKLTLHGFLQAHFSGTSLLATLESSLTNAELRLAFFEQKEESLGALKRFQEDIEACMQAKRVQIKEYYDSVFDDAEDRCLVFDLGYSGSIGKAVSAITGKTADKLYFWEEAGNKTLDAALGSETRVFMKGEWCNWVSLICEELFSPCEGGVVDFMDAQPVFEETAFSEAHRKDLAAVHTACQDYAASFCATLGEYAPRMTLREPDGLVALCRTFFTSAPFCNLHIFKDIVFPDPVCYASPFSLERKVERCLPQETVFTGTGFDDPGNVLALSPDFAVSPGKVGIHVHLFFVSVADDILRYLQDFPVPFDLYVTITDEGFTQTARNLFNSASLPRVQVVEVLTVPNRGRDIPSWVLGMRPYQDKYDLFCHVHSKKSDHIRFGDRWRHYLFDNVLRADSVSEIFAVFRDHPSVGCLFPAIYPDVRLTMTFMGNPVYGSDHEYELICDMLRRMGLWGELRRSEIFFSAGTMLWYRPDALRQLFSYDLTLDEFAEEPLGVGGTLAHAVERMPALLAERNGYSARTFTKYT